MGNSYSTQDFFRQVEASGYIFCGCRNFCLSLSENKCVEMPYYQHQHIVEGRTEFFSIAVFFPPLCYKLFSLQN